MRVPPASPHPAPPIDRRSLLASAGAALGAWALAQPAPARTDQPAPSSAQPEPHAIPALAFLGSGINLSHWLWLPQAQEASARWNFIARDELARLRERGLTHVRLPLDPLQLWDKETMRTRAGAWGEAVRAVETCLGAGLGIVVDVHPLGSRSPWIMPAKDTGATPHLEGLWSELASLCSVWDPARLALEVMNEPHDIDKPEFWHDAQRRVLPIIRAACPKHTIIATGDQWGGIDGLQALPPLDDANVVYSFHFYDPMTFTHQGATWGWEGWQHLSGVSYPLTCDQSRTHAKTIDNDSGRKGLMGEHCNGEDAQQFGGWNAARIAHRIDLATAWAKRHARNGQPLPLYCGEFGVYKKFAPPTARAAWLGDVTNALRERGIGWAMWDYVGGFALCEEGSRRVDPPIAQALGMLPAKD